ncbi:hypothetical protein NDU88_004933 [Pleurodeles waltl]|uniref:Uncharacterized protein n=1 Tax=Pleurodeles waltl TaxID=8319 RepID=A0AAV7T906_PLEWA|nr:hypothetical protein NDU88_004933 [Pleurodeles waltl]
MNAHPAIPLSNSPADEAAMRLDNSIPFGPHPPLQQKRKVKEMPRNPEQTRHDPTAVKQLTRIVPDKAAARFTDPVNKETSALCTPRLVNTKSVFFGGIRGLIKKPTKSKDSRA